MRGKTTAVLNVRARGSMTAPILGIIPMAVDVDIVSKRGKWGRIQYTDDQTGYICLDYVTIKED